MKPLALIIEDDPQLNEIIALTLQADFEITACSDGTSGWNRLSEITPHILVLDLHLPGMPGKDILAKLRADERFKDTRVILATADERLAETLTEAADIVLLKPVSPAQLRELANRLKSI
jgi:two-component system response regulator/two-component system chemotaxis response regulator CheY